VGGVYAGDPDRLSIRHAFPRLYALEQEHGSLVAGGIARMRARRRSRAPRVRAQSVSFQGGLGALGSALEKHLGADLLTEVELLEIEPGAPFRLKLRQAGGPLRELCADSVIVTTPAYASALLPLRGAPQELSSLTSVEYPPLTSVALGFHRKALSHPLDGFGVLVPQREALDILGTLFTSSLFPGRAPAEHELLTTYVGGMRSPELAGLPEAALVRRVTQTLQKLRLVKGEPVYQRVTRHPHAIAQYHLGFDQVRAALDANERLFRGLFFGGPTRGGASVGDCICSGLELAARVAA
jgi:oxygen-dependent protoporphyrinogen oxidase